MVLSAGCARMQRCGSFTGESLLFGIEERQIEGFLTQRGYTDIVDADFEQLKRLYRTGASRERTVADVYTLVHADVQRLEHFIHREGDQ